MAYVQGRNLSMSRHFDDAALAFETLLCLSSVRTAAICAFGRDTCLRPVKETSMPPGCHTAKPEARFVLAGLRTDVTLIGRQ